MAGSSSQVSLSPTVKRENGGSTLPRISSPGGSEVGSIASGIPSRGGGGGRSSINLPARLGNLHGAGLSSLQLALGEASSSSNTTSSLAGFNAISTLLNDPKRPQRAIDPNSSRYPPISQSHTDLPKVKRSDYEGYISSTQKEWLRFQKNLKLGSQGRARLEADEAEAEAKQSSIDRGQSPAQLDIDHTTVIGKRKLPPLSTVPQVFFAEDFDLGNPYTFDLVTERYKAAGATGSTRNGSAVPAGGYDVALNQMLQEKLSYYSDVVEQHLILEISARSTSFFAALGNLQDLESEAAHCLTRVESLKAELEDKEEGIAKAGLRVIREQAKRREMVERLEAVGILQLLCEKKDLCRLLVQSGEWSEALEVMDLLRDLVQGKEKLQSITSGNSSLPPHVDLDLMSIGSVKAILPQLDEMKESISTQLETELMNILSQDLNEQIGEPNYSDMPPALAIDMSILAVKAKGEPSPVAQKVTSPSEVPSEQTTTASAADITDAPASAKEMALQERISAHLHGLIRTQGVDRAIDSYREIVVKATRATLWKFLCQSRELQADDQREDLATLLEDDEAASGKADAKLGPGGAEAASKLREMSHKDFLDMTRFVLMGLTKSIHAVDLQTRVILRILDEAGKSGTENGRMGAVVMMPMGVSPSLPTLLSSMLADVGSLTHTLASRLLSLRSSTHISLPLSEILSIFHLCWSFILQSESICNRMIIGLRGVILNQAKSWLASFHRVRIERAARAVEEEMWNQAEITSEQQKHVKLIVDSATSDPTSLVVSGEEISTGQPNGEEKSQLSDNAKSKTLEIEGRQFFVVGATLDVLELLMEYIKVVINLPLLSTETMGRVVEFSKQFNSRTCQVVLGAGAMRSAGLKNITAKHLALASQSLSVMITLIPYVRETVRRHLSPKQAVMLIEFDKLKRDYQEHQYEIHSKLVAIMSDRLTVHCRTMASVQWNADTEATDPIRPAADLAKETTTLHKVLSKYLQASVVETVIGQVLNAVDKRISAEFLKIEVKEDAAIKKMNIAKAFFDEKFAALKNVEWSAKDLESAIEEQKAALEKLNAANAPPPEKKEGPAAYKPRINIFGRKNQSIPGTPPSGRPSTETASEVKTEEPVDTATATETTIEAKPEIAGDAAPRKEVDSTPSVPAKDEPNENAVVSEQVANEEQPPVIPSKDDTESKLKSGPELSVETHDSATIPPASPLLTSPPATPTRSATPFSTSQDSANAPTPGRMTLQQRLAEAARKRAQGGAGRRSQLSAGPNSSGASTPVKVEESAKVEVDSSLQSSSNTEVQGTGVESKAEPVQNQESAKTETGPVEETPAKSETEPVEEESAKTETEAVAKSDEPEGAKSEEIEVAKTEEPEAAKVMEPDSSKTVEATEVVVGDATEEEKEKTFPAADEGKAEEEKEEVEEEKKKKKKRKKKKKKEEEDKEDKDIEEDKADLPVVGKETNDEAEATVSEETKAEAEPVSNEAEHAE